MAEGLESTPGDDPSVEEPPRAGPNVDGPNADDPGGDVSILLPSADTTVSAPPPRAGVNLLVGAAILVVIVALVQSAVTSSATDVDGRVRSVGDAQQIPFQDDVDPGRPFMPGATDPLEPAGSAAEPGDGDEAADGPAITDDVESSSRIRPSRTESGSGSGSEAVSREVPTTAVRAESSPPVPGPWAAVTHTTAAGYVATDVGCAAGTSAAALDAFFSERVGPMIGQDYQHVYSLGGGRALWLFQDVFVDPTGAATRLDAAQFVHNAAMLQDGACFTLYHRGSERAAQSFEPGSGEQQLSTWFWPMGGEAVGGQVVVFWAEMRRDGYTPGPGDGLGWHPVRTWIGAYDSRTLQRLSFSPAPNSGVSPIYGYAVGSQNGYSYLFGNTFEQNLVREGGYANGPHSATSMWLARVPAGAFGSPPEYRTADGWSPDPAAAVPIVQRFWTENPMQPRFVNGQWVAVTKVDGYWGEQLAVDVALDPWGPWTTVELRGVSPRGGDPKMNTYHAHLMPWLDRGALVVSISQNARNMTRDAYPMPARYRIGFFRAALVPPPPPVETTTPEETTTIVETTIGEESTTIVEGSTTSDSTSTSTPAATDLSPPPTTVAPTTTASTTTTVAPSPTTTPPTNPPETDESAESSATVP